MEAGSRILMMPFLTRRSPRRRTGAAQTPIRARLARLRQETRIVAHAKPRHLPGRLSQVRARRFGSRNGSRSHWRSRTKSPALASAGRKLCLASKDEVPPNAARSRTTVDFTPPGERSRAAPKLSRSDEGTSRNACDYNVFSSSSPRSSLGPMNCTSL